MSTPPSSDSTLFVNALERPPAERAAFIDAACAGDAARRARIEALMQAHERGAGLLETPVARPAAGFRHEEGPGDSIDHYKLLLKIGEGGCGVVFLAEQNEPVRRRVALKVIKAGMDTHEVIARFEAERQALALMDHPGICKVLEAGATITGRPYFVMELVKGVPITKYCDENLLPTSARLDLFMQVCHAVQHAHQKGIIHRDLKPSNILVTLLGTAAVPKVIDFGIAKATQGRLTDATLVTAFEQFMGTPAYMAPEQAEMGGLDIDTRCDVYSLGVLLYELLTGRPPFDPKSLMVASRDELLRIIREVEPPKPSTHLRTLAAVDRSTIALRHGTDPGKLRLQIRGDLDWIVMKALEKKRGRRYDTPAALADDIARHLRHEPIVARPQGTFYRMGKFVRRHRVGVAAVSTIAFVLIAGTIVSTALAVRATRAERRALAANTLTENMVAFMLGELLTEVQKFGRLDLLDLVRTRTDKYFASLDKEDVSDEALLLKVKSLRQAGEVLVKKANYAGALPSFAAAYVRAAALVARQPKNGDMLFERAQVEYWIGFLHRRRGDLASASEWLTRYRDSGTELVKLDPANSRGQQELASGHHNLAVLDSDRGNLDAARLGFLAKLAITEKLAAASPDKLSLQLSLATTISFLGTVAVRQGDFAGALDYYRDETSRQEALLARDPKNMEQTFRIAVSRSLQADVLMATDKRDEAKECLAQALAMFDVLVAHDAANKGWLSNSLSTHVKKILLDRAGKNLPQAVRHLDEIRPRIEAVVTAEPSDRGAAGLLVTAWRLEAELRLATGRADASHAANRAVEHAASLVKGETTDAKIVGECALAHVIAGTIASAAQQRDAALRHWQTAIDLLKPLLTDSNNWRLLDPAARALTFLGRQDDSRALVARLHALGYRPLQPWPEAVAALLPVSSTQNK